MQDKYCLATKRADVKITLSSKCLLVVDRKDEIIDAIEKHESNGKAENQESYKSTTKGLKWR